MEDLLEQANEIQESLGRSYAVPDEIDEAELEAGTLSILCEGIAEGWNFSRLELDALELDEETEGPSYLADLNKAPDFIDEPPLEVAEVSKNLSFLCIELMIMCISHKRRRRLRQLREQLCVTLNYGRQNTYPISV